MVWGRVYTVQTEKELIRVYGFSASKKNQRRTHSWVSNLLDETCRWESFPYIQHRVIFIRFWILKHHFLLYLLDFYIFHPMLRCSNYDQIEGAAHDW